MKIRQGCEVLAARLTDLLHQATAVRRTARRVAADELDQAKFKHVEQCFLDMAAVIAETIDDVNDRLMRLDDVLQAIDDQSAEIAEDAQACVA